VRAALYDARGNVLPETMVKNERLLTATEDGGAEIDALEALKQIEEAIDDVLEKAKNVEGEIEAVAASSFWHSLVGVDERGKPSTKVFGWADTRSREYVSVLREKLDEPAVHNRTGARFHSSFWTAKLLWLKNEQPKLFAKTAKWLSFSDFVGLKLFDKKELPLRTRSKWINEGFHMLAFEKLYENPQGVFVTSVSMASATGIFDIRQCKWDEELLKFLNLKPENLPEVLTEDFHTFTLQNKYARRWKRLKNAEWFPAIGDGAANNIGAGCIEKTEAALMIGTSGAMRVAFRGDVPAKIPDGLWCYRIDRKRLIIGGALSDGGGLYRWLKDNLKLEGTDDQIEAEIKKRAPDAHGLTFLPFLAGERSTGYHENAFGASLGLRSATDAIDIVQAALEAVAYRFAEIYDQLNEICEIKEIIASGGALRESPVWTQIIADVLAQKMSLPDTREASSRGAVLLALEQVGKIEDIAELKTPEGTKFNFNKKRHAVYADARKRHKRFYTLLMTGV